MEPRNEGMDNPTTNEEFSEGSKDTLSAEIASGIKRYLLSETTVTYNNVGGGIGRDCLLTTSEERNHYLFIIGN